MTPAFELLGAGRPLVLIPGTFSDRRSWLKQLGALSPRFRCLLVDLRGVGESPDPGLAFTPDDLVEDLLAAMDAAGFERAHLLGHSLGAQVALLLAARHPDRVGRVIAESPSLYTDAHLAWVLGLWQALAASDLDDHDLHAGLVTLAFGRSAFERLVPAVVRDLDRHPIARETIRRYIECDLAQDLRPHLRRVDATTLVVAGAEDALGGVAQAELVAAAIPDARLEVLAGCGHSPHLERPRDFTRLAVDFLSP